MHGMSGVITLQMTLKKRWKPFSLLIFLKNSILFGNDADAPFNMLWSGIPEYLMPEGATQGKFQHLSF